MVLLWWVAVGWFVLGVGSLIDATSHSAPATLYDATPEGLRATLWWSGAVTTLIVWRHPKFMPTAQTLLFLAPMWRAQSMLWSWWNGDNTSGWYFAMGNALLASIAVMLGRASRDN